MKSILIVGEDLLLREMTAALVADLAVAIRTADKIDEVEEEYRQARFDLIILLDTYPFFNGSKHIARLRPDGLRRPELFVFSWQHSEQVVLSLLERGITQYITFPINIRRLRRKIRDVLNP